MKVSSLILAALILFSGCTTVPRAGIPREVETGVYIVRISQEYANNPEAVKYAINQFVKSMGYESYDAELTKSPGFFRRYAEYTVTMPGSTPVEDLPKVRVFDQGGTELALELIITPIVVGLLVIGVLALFFPFLF